MEKSIVKKKLHLKPEEKKYVAKMIDNGGSLQDVDRWYQMRFGKKITTSVYYRLKQQCKTILADTNDKKKTKKYTRKCEKDLEPFEEHLKIKIAEKMESSGSFHWTYLLLQSLAVTERMKEPFNKCDEIQKMCFSSRYWTKFMQRKNLNFSGRKSDQKFFSPTELENFRLTLNPKLMFYPVNNILNMDETGLNYLETRGRIICERGKRGQKYFD